MSNSSPKGQQPEALRSLEAAAKANSQKPAEQGLTATDQTAPTPASLEQEEQTAAEILRAGAKGDTKGMAEAAKKGTDR
jgi:excinuclease UvrABC helicase subunit UvrB